MGLVCLWATLLALAFLDMSISAAKSKWPSQHTFTATSPLLVPGIFGSASVSGSHPALQEGGLGRGLCGSSLNSRTLLSASQTCVGFPQPHELALCVAERLHLFRFGSPAHSLCHRASTHVFQLSPPALCIAGLVCTCLASAGLPSMSRGFCALLSAP